VLLQRPVSVASFKGFKQVRQAWGLKQGSNMNAQGISMVGTQNGTHRHGIRRSGLNAQRHAGRRGSGVRAGSGTRALRVGASASAQGSGKALCARSGKAAAGGR